MSLRRLRSPLPVSALVTSFATGCGPTYSAPPATPDKTIPVLAAEPPPVPEGYGRVVFDAPNQRARVLRVSSSSGVVETGHNTKSMEMLATQPVCITPCSANLLYGQHEMLFVSQTDDERASGLTIDVGRSTTIVRHEMGGRTSHANIRSAGTVIGSIGLTGVITGLTFVGTGALLNSADSSNQKPGDGIMTTGWIVTGVSAAVIGLGLGMFVLARDDVQPGATTQWIPNGAEAPGAPKSIPIGEAVRYRVPDDGAAATERP